MLHNSILFFLAEEANEIDLESSSTEISLDEHAPPAPKRKPKSVFSKDGKIEYSTQPPIKTKQRAKDICPFTPSLNNKSKTIGTETDAFELFIDKLLVDRVVHCSNDYAQTENISYKLTKNDLYQWMGINLYFWLIKSKNMNLKEL